MADDLTIKKPHISRSGRVLKKSAKLKEFEEFYIDEKDLRKTPHKMSDNRRVVTAAGTSQVHPNSQWRSKQTFSSSRKSLSKLSFQEFDCNPQRSLTKTSRKASTLYSRKIPPKKVKDDAKYSAAKGCPKEVSYSNSVEVLETEECRLSESVEESSSSSTDTTTLSSSSCSLVGEVSTPDYREIKQQKQHHAAFTEHLKYSEKESSSDTSRSSSEAIDSELIVVLTDDDEQTTYREPACEALNASAPKSVVPRRESRTESAKRAPPAVQKLTSFMLWNNKNRKKIFAQYKHLSLSEISKKVGEAWRAVPLSEKALWKRKAKQLVLKGLAAKDSTACSNEVIEAADSKDDPLISPRLLGIAPIDAAAHLKLLGDCLTGIGMKLTLLDDEPSPIGVYNCLLDVLLCAVGPLLCLTSEIVGLEHLPTDAFKKTLSHIAYFLPGVE